MKAEEGWRCEGDAAPGPYSTRTARMLLPGTLGSSRSKIFVTCAFVSCAATLVDSSEAATSSSKAILLTVTLLLIGGFNIRRLGCRQLRSALPGRVLHAGTRCRGYDPNQPPIVRCSARRPLPP